MNKILKLENLVLLVMLNFCIYSAAQDSVNKENPIIYADMLIGGAWGNGGGFTVGGTFYHQHKKHLFSFNYISNIDINVGLLSPPLLPIPIITKHSESRDFGILYGKRITNHNNSLSFSAGISYNKLIQEAYINGDLEKRSISYIGIPYEISFKFFKKQKSRHRIYLVIPIGKPTGFSRSIGIKLVGNISKHSYIGLGISYGFGWHKNYSP